LPPKPTDMKNIYSLAFLITIFATTFGQTYHNLSGGSLTQNWATTTLITANDDWSGIPSIIGFLGQDLITATGTDPQVILTGASSLINDLDVIANQSNTNITNGGVAEFDGIANPVVALQGSGTADAPNIIIYLNTLSVTNVRVQYNLRDIDGSADNSIQPVALQYRIGNTGNFTNLPAGFIADASSGPSLATLVTAIDVTLPSACDNQAQVEIRIITANAVGNDEWIGIDDINITSTPSGPILPIATIAAGTVPAEPSTTGNFAVTLNTPAPTGGLTVNYTVGGTATSGTDYAFLAGSVFIAEAATTANINISVNDDVLADPDETIIATLTAGTGYNLGVPNTASLIITDNEITNINNYPFNACAAIPVNGFTQVSVTGTQVWGCTTFGRDANNPPLGSAQFGLQMNGFDNTIPSNVINEDWLISPSFDLTATTFPLLSFWSRTKFNGSPLQLKISTDYISGLPSTGTWTDINGRFPNQTSDVWTLSSYINLSAFKQANVHFAFVYNSTNDDGARWTLDDIRLDNSTIPPPASLTVSTTDMQFGYAASGNTINKTFTVSGNDITGDITLTASTGFLLSIDGTTFSNAVTFLQAAANNIPVTVYVRFAPAQNNINFNGSITITTQGVSNTVVSLKGTSIDPVNTLEVVNWNMEWFGSTTLGPTNDAQQQANAQTILQNIGADIYGLVEVVDEARLATVVSNMPGYSYVICNYGSHTNTNEAGATPLTEAQKEAFVYKTSMFANITTQPLVSQGINSVNDLTNPAYNYFASGRFPFMMTADVTLNGVTKTIRFVLLHAKANTAPTATSYARRKSGSDTLHYTLNNLYPNDNIVFLGDINDDLDITITDGIPAPKTTSYVAFTTDNANFSSPTLALSLAGKKSTVSFNDVIDHVILSDEMQGYYMNATANIITDVTSLVTSYGSTTSDHYPVFTRFAFDPVILPVNLVSFSAKKENNQTKLSWTTAQEINTKEFIIERSADGINFKSIANVKATGNSTAAVNYNVVDMNPAKGVNLYRLKMIDIDGKSEYSAVRRVNFDNNNSYSAYPNPAKNIINIAVDNVNGLTADAEIYNMQSQLLMKRKINSASQITPVDISSLSSGLYMLKIIANNGTATMQKFIKQ
jgi:hypothetical protein